MKLTKARISKLKKLVINLESKTIEKIKKNVDCSDEGAEKIKKFHKATAKQIRKDLKEMSND